MENLIGILTLLASPVTLLLIFAGVVFGIVVGANPGLNGAIGVALLFPVTYSLSPTNGLLMLGGIYMGATYGGSISAILLNCPGSGEASCTALDGYPMALQGRGKEALYYSVLASAIGGLLGVVIMIFLPRF